MFQNNRIAKYAHVIWHNHWLPFCLACIGTDNKFTTMDAMQRWKYMVTECDNINIAALSFGGDGNSHAMKYRKIFSPFSALLWMNC